jgi:putative exosortase-associated protein (TIGR04073 family)
MVNRENEMRLRRVVAVLLFGAMLTTLAGLAQADVYRSIEDSTPQEIVDAMATKGVRGAANFVTGWLELPKQIYLTNRDDGWARAAVIGPFKGIGMTLVRTLAGAGELATFFVAYPNFYAPWFEPAYVWQKE